MAELARSRPGEPAVRLECRRRVSSIVWLHSSHTMGSPGSRHVPVQSLAFEWRDDAVWAIGGWGASVESTLLAVGLGLRECARRDHRSV